MKSYCVKQKKVTECVKGSERYAKTKNNRLMLKCTCVECGITKTKFVGEAAGGNMLVDELLWKGMKGAKNMALLGASKAIKSDTAKKGIKKIADKYINQGINTLTSDISKKLNPYSGGGVDIQKQLAKFGELHMRTPSGKKYNYCGPGTKLDERLASSNPKYRDPINKLDAVCQKHDIDYGNSKSLADKHAADKLLLHHISQIPYSERPWGTTAVQGIISAKKKLGLGVSKNGKGRRVRVGKKG